MYHLIRRIHLFSALVLVTFVVMYFVTGLPITHAGWFPKGEPARSTRTESLQFEGEPGGRELGEYFARAFDIRGIPQLPARQRDGRWKLTWYRPGTGYEVFVSPDGKQAEITTIDFPARNIAIGLHRIHGYGHGWLYNVWAFLLDVTSAATILFAVTGVFLWYKSTSNRVPGWICLGIGCGFTVATILYFLMHR